MKFLGLRHQGRAGFVSASAVAAFLAAPFGVPHAQGAQPTTGSVALKYPTTARSGQADDLNGVRVPDPYRWLENIASSDVRSWVVAQNALAGAFE